MSKKGNFTEMFIGINIRWYNAIKTQSLIECINASHSMVNYYYGRAKLYPDPQNVLRAFKFCKPDEIRAVIIGQDPYKGGIADGLSFSTKTGVIQPSLRNIYKSMIATGVMSEMPSGSDCSDLSGWAKQGVLMLNMALMCDSKTGKVHEHWHKYTSEIVSWLSSRNNGIVFFLFGRKAQNLKRSINPRKHHVILEWGHPSPLNKTRPPFEQFRGWIRVNINWSAHSAEKYERAMSQITNPPPEIETPSEDTQDETKIVDNVNEDTQDETKIVDNVNEDTQDETKIVDNVNEDTQDEIETDVCDVNETVDEIETDVCDVNETVDEIETYERYYVHPKKNKRTSVFLVGNPDTGNGINFDRKDGDEHTLEEIFSTFPDAQIYLSDKFYKMAVSMEHLKTRAYNAKNMSEEDRTKVRNMT